MPSPPTAADPAASPHAPTRALPAEPAIRRAGGRRALAAAAALVAAVGAVAAGATLWAARGGPVARASQPAEAAWRHVATWPLPPPPALPLALAFDDSGALFVADARTRRILHVDAGGALQHGWTVDGVPLALAFDAGAGAVLTLVLDASGPVIDARRRDGTPLWRDRVEERLIRGREDLLGVDLGRSPDDVGPVVLYNGLATRYDRTTGALVPAGSRALADDGRPMRLAVLSRTLVAAVEPLQQRLVLADLARGVRAVRPLTDVVPLAVAAGPLPAHFTPPAGAPAAGGAPAVVAHVLARGADRDRPGLVVVAVAPDGREVGRWPVPAAQAGAPADDGFRWSLSVAADGLAFSRGVERLTIERFGADGVHRFSLPAGRPAPPFGRRQARMQSNLVTTAGGLSLTAGPSGAVAVLDAGGSRIVTVASAGAAAGSAVHETILPYDVVDIAADGGAAGAAAGPPSATAYFMSTADDRLRRVSASAAVARYTDPWAAACACPLGGRLALAAPGLWVTRPAARRLARLDVDDGAEVERSPAGALGLWPADVEPAGDGDVWVADGVGGHVERWRPGGGVPAQTIPLGGLAGPQRLATGRLADGTAVVAALLGDGDVVLHRAADGRRVAAFTPRLAAGEAVLADDLLVLDGGEIVVADAGRSALHVFAASPATATAAPTATPSATATAGLGSATATPSTPTPPTPTPTPSPPTASPTATVAPVSCRAAGAKAVDPDRVVLGQTAAVSLSLQIDCPGLPRLIGADVMLVIDRSTSMTGDGLAAAKAAAKRFIAALDVRVHQVGVVSFGTDVRIEAALGADPAPPSTAIGRLVAGGETNLGGAMATAGQHLSARRRADALPVVVLLTDGNDTVGAADPVATSDWLKSWGVQVYAVGLGTAADAGALGRLASTPAHVLLAAGPSDLVPIYAGLVRRVGAYGLVGALMVDEALTPGIDLEPGSAQPAAVERAGGLAWSRAVVGPEGFGAGFLVRPTRLGRFSVSTAAVATWSDGAGGAHRYVFPTVEIEVVLPSPTPTPTASPTPAPFLAHLPVLWRSACIPAPKPADVVLLVDTSSSMTGAKLVEAKAAAKAFVALLDLPRDHAAVVAFDEQPRATTGLSGSQAVLAAAIDALTLGNGTRIDRALEAAHAMLATTRADPTRRAVVVILTDGGQSGPIPPVFAAADALRGGGTVVYAIGLGPDADVGLLGQIAGPGRLFTAPTPADLAAIYAEVAAVTGCR